MTNKVKPISPKDAVANQKMSIPDFVIAAFNEMISKGIGCSKSVTFKQDDVAKLALDRAPEGTTYRTLIDNHWLDVEPLFQEQGWKVTYDKPGYNESYVATFTFSVNS